INKEGLFNLDVDDTIWQDFDYTDGDLPDWLASEPNRQGINSMLVIDRCDEELSRLHSERSILQNWMQEEWAALIALEKETDDAPMAHHLTKYKQTLIAQACYWIRDTRSIEPSVILGNSWGPSEKELMDER
ncbi:hypothetical protein FB107DRAFT_197122, partial [Schizophyllum commune]